MSNTQKRAKGEKSKKMEDLTDAIARKVYGISRTEALEKKICVECGEPATEFRDIESANEYAISGLCQKCQDKTWGQ